MPWNNGVYTRGYPSWSNDAAQNLPISSAKFDTEDNDFATGLNNCLTKDGLNAPSGQITWGLTNAQPFALTRGSDGSVFSVARTGGSNNPLLQIVLADATGIAINLSTSQQLALAIAGTNVIAITATAVTLSQATTVTGNLQVNAGAASGITIVGGTAGSSALISEAGAGTSAAKLLGNSSAGNSFGLNVLAGTTSADYAELVQNQAGTVTFREIFGDGHGYLGPGSPQGLSWNAGGQYVFAAPSSSITAVGISGAANAYTLKVTGSSTSGQSLGLEVLAGTNSSDVSLVALNQAGTAGYLLVYGDGEVVVAQPTTATNTGGTSGSSTVWQAGYLEAPLNSQTGGGYNPVLGDRGKFILGGNAHTYTIPANSSVAFPVGTTMLIGNNGGGSITISITTDTLTWWPSGGTGSRTLANNSIATLYKVGSTSWLIWGFGLT